VSQVLSQALLWYVIWKNCKILIESLEADKALHVCALVCFKVDYLVLYMFWRISWNKQIGYCSF